MRYLIAAFAAVMVAVGSLFAWGQAAETWSAFVTAAPSLPLPYVGTDTIPVVRSNTTFHSPLTSVLGLPYTATNATLKALTGGSFSIIVRDGFAAAGDGGAATYTWNAASTCTDDGGSCIQPNTGTGRWLIVAQPSYDIRIFGADATGAVDATAKIQAAVDACQAAQGGIVFIPAGNFKIAGTITNSGSYWCKFQGVGSGNASGGTGSSRLVASSTPTMLSITSNGGVAVEGIAFDSSVTRTSGAYMLSVANSNNNNYIHDVSFSNYYWALNLAWNNGTVDHALFYNPAITNGIGITIAGNAGCDLLHDIQMFPPGAGSQPAYGILIDGPSGCTLISDSDIIQQGTDLGLVASSGQTIASVFVENTFLDTAQTGFLAIATGTGSIVRVQLVNTWTSSHSVAGVRILNNGTGVVGGFGFTNHMAVYNAAAAFTLGGGTGPVSDLSVENSIIANSTGAGIDVIGPVAGLTIAGNRIGAYGGVGSNTGQAVNVAAGTTDCLINSNRMVGNSSATVPVTDSSGICQIKINTPATVNN
jgi:hypothetical protein